MKEALHYPLDITGRMRLKAHCFLLEEEKQIHSLFVIPSDC
jgi:hypothetical protein